MHGKDAVVEEILDRRPYDYVTDRTTLATAGGRVRTLHTMEFEPTAAGTTIHLRYGQATTKREREQHAVIAVAYGEALRSGVPALIARWTAGPTHRPRRRRLYRIHEG